MVDVDYVSQRVHVVGRGRRRESQEGEEEEKEESH